ncbi:MAG: DUF87 domain-containing protein [Nanoarchaeota archaeon]|jgi:hypothetical protein|nr:DUF87 domain-containing protein [Nanoarchaeota archaeon]
MKRLMGKKKMRKLSFIFVLLLLSLSFVAATDYGEDITTDNYKISRSYITRAITPGEIFNDFIEIENLGQSKLDLNFLISGKAEEVCDLDNMSTSILPGEMAKISFRIKGIEGSYEGFFKISGAITKELPMNITVEEKDLNSPFLISVAPTKKRFDITKDMNFQINIRKLKRSDLEGISFLYTLYDDANNSYVLGTEDKIVLTSTNLIKDFFPPEEVTMGNFYLEVEASYEGYVVKDKAPFILYQAFFDIMIFGFMSMWVFLSIIAFILISFLTWYLIKRHIESKKKYKMSLDLKTIPKKGKDNLFLGRIAETNTFTYYNPNKLTTHSIIAGATGGGKSITAQVMIEECLMKDIAVIVFDPTAQWSGMLRKCDDKKMMSFYPTFKLKPQDARGFKGNVRMIKSARQVVDLNKHIHPGQIQIFSLNKLDPSEMDIFVASIIRQIFRSDPKEYPGLKVLLVFDEVHRLLPKFGGSGAGFLQIERACREFRKWGLGVMLVSQVLNDFAGQIKANISTEVQMRTRDEGDLNRIKTKYGEEFLQSLVKASAGVGMFANPAYNHAHPYFINFRPILHNTRRLTDEELEEYNKFNDIVDDLEYQVEQLDAEKVDTFDLKMELKLIKDKIMSGSFSVVDIYLEGLTPRVAKEWDKLGKKPKVQELELLSEEEIQAGIAEAKEKHDAEVEKEEVAEEVAAKVEVKLDEKIVASLTFDNGVMISSLKEMKEYLPNMADDIFAIHINEEKNDVAKWVGEQFGEAEGKKLEGILEKNELATALAKIGVVEEKESSVVNPESSGKTEKGSKEEEGEHSETEEENKKEEVAEESKENKGVSKE